MKLRFRQSGGFAGLERGCEVAVATLAPELRKLVEQVMAQPPAHPPQSSRGADITQYSLNVDSAGDRREFRFDDSSLPPALAPLVAHLSAMSKPLPLT